MAGERQTEPHQAVLTTAGLVPCEMCENGESCIHCLAAELARVRAERNEAQAQHHEFVEGLTRALNDAGVPAMPSWPSAIRHLADRPQNQAAEIVALLRSYTNVHMTAALADLIEHKYVGRPPQR